MTTLQIQMLHGWQIDVVEKPDRPLRWQARAIKDGATEFGLGVDKEMALMNVANRCGLDAMEVLESFGLRL